MAASAGTDIPVGVTSLAFKDEARRPENAARNNVVDLAQWARTRPTPAFAYQNAKILRAPPELLEDIEQAPPNAFFVGLVHALLLTGLFFIGLPALGYIIVKGTLLFASLF